MWLPKLTPSSQSPTQGSGSLRKKPFPNKLPPFQSRSRTFSRFRFPRLKLFLLLFFKRHSILLSNANIWESGNLLRSDRNKLQRTSIQRNKPERESSATGKKDRYQIPAENRKKPEKLFPLKRDSLFRVTDDCHRFSSFYLSFSGILRSFQNWFESDLFGDNFRSVSV